MVLPVPSKVIEYLSLCSCVASTLSTPIKNIYPEAINWIDSDPEKAEELLISFFLSHMDEKGNLSGLKENPVKERILIDYGVINTGKKLAEFISSL